MRLIPKHIKQINIPDFMPQSAPDKIHNSEVGTPKLGASSNAKIIPHG